MKIETEQKIANMSYGSSFAAHLIKKMIEEDKIPLSEISTIGEPGGSVTIVTKGNKDIVIRKPR